MNHLHKVILHHIDDTEHCSDVVSVVLGEGLHEGGAHGQLQVGHWCRVDRAMVPSEMGVGTNPITI